MVGGFVEVEGFAVKVALWVFEDLREGTRDLAAVLFAAGEGLVGVMGEVRYGEFLQAMLDDGGVVLRGFAAVPGFASEGDDFGDGEREGELLVLWQDGAFAREFEGAVGGEGLAVVGDLSALWAQVAGEEFDEGGFARAVWADDAGVVAGGEVDV